MIGRPGRRRCGPADPGPGAPRAGALARPRRPRTARPTRRLSDRRHPARATRRGPRQRTPHRFHDLHPALRVNTATAGSDAIDHALTRSFRFGEHAAVAFLRASNLTDDFGFQASAVSTARSLSPLAGRALAAGVRVGF